jgi:DNA-binding XRE family transcriptional regulator
MSKERAEPSELRKKLAENLTKLRNAKDLNQAELAQAVGISRFTITDLENGRVNINQDVLDALATFFHTSTDDLLGRRIESESLQMEELFDMCRGLSSVQQEAVIKILELQLRAMGVR